MEPVAPADVLIFDKTMVPASALAAVVVALDPLAGAWELTGAADAEVYSTIFQVRTRKAARTVKLVEGSKCRLPPSLTSIPVRRHVASQLERLWQLPARLPLQQGSP